MPAALEFDRVSKRYTGLLGRNPFLALDDFSLTVERGEIFGFLGPNGAGKTTAIHIALGLMFPSSGGGRLLGKAFGDAEARRRVGFLAESVSYYNRTAAETVRFYGGLNGLVTRYLDENIHPLLEQVGLREVADKKIGKFSRGMLQRVGSAQALAGDPELLILDEPTSALDPAARVMVRELLLHARQQGKTIFLSSHLLSEIELICDRVAIINRGRVARLGRLDDLLQAEEQYEITWRRAAGGMEEKRMVAGREQRAAIEQIWTAGGEIVGVSQVRKSLEELFLELTAEPEVKR